MSHLYLTVAILAEVIATMALRASAGFTRLIPSAVVILGYGVAFFCLSLALRTVPVGIAYAIWSGVGIVLISALGWIVHRQALDLPALLGVGLILSGVLIVNFFSSCAGH